MDIYQIWTTYNKQWSRYEILAFTGVLILVCTAMAVCVHRKKLNIIQAAAVLALVVFLGIVFGSTVWSSGRNTAYVYYCSMALGFIRYSWNGCPVRNCRRRIWMCDCSRSGSQSDMVHSRLPDQQNAGRI